jgi:3-oxoadipate enol-lactonase
MGVPLSHQLDGPPEAPVIVLSGSLGTDRSMWDPQAGPLSERFRVLRYDLRGHGASPVPRGPYSIAELGEDLLALLDQLAIERASLCGLSIGGMISMWVAAHAPERVQRLVLCCTSARLGPESSYGERAAAVRAGGVQGIADAVLARWFTPAFAPANPRVIERMRAILCATAREGYAGCCEALAAMDLRPDLAAPTLVLAGEEDPATPPAHGRVIAEGIPAARLTVLAGAAHIANIERAELVTALFLRFLQPTDEEAIS